MPDLYLFAHRCHHKKLPIYMLIVDLFLVCIKRTQLRLTLALISSFTNLLLSLCTPNTRHSLVELALFPCTHTKTPVWGLHNSFCFKRSSLKAGKHPRSFSNKGIRYTVNSSKLSLKFCNVFFI